MLRRNFVPIKGSAKTGAVSAHGVSSSRSNPIRSRSSARRRVRARPTRGGGHSRWPERRTENILAESGPSAVGFRFETALPRSHLGSRLPLSQPEPWHGKVVVALRRIAPSCNAASPDSDVCVSRSGFFTNNLVEAIRPVLGGSPGPFHCGGACMGDEKHSPRSRPVRILIVDGHAAARDGLALLLSRQPDLAVVGATGDREEALDLATTHSPDVV